MATFTFSKITTIIAGLAMSLSAFAVVDLNKATQAELESVKGIGPATAKSIMEYRTKTGGFKNIDELKNIKGFGGKRIAKLAPELSINGTVTPMEAVKGMADKGMKKASAMTQDAKAMVAPAVEQGKAMVKDTVTNTVNDVTNTATEKAKNKIKSMMPF